MTKMYKFMHLYIYKIIIIFKKRHKKKKLGAMPL
jgi:hypothetical protein